MRALETLLGHVVDYAGLFPPAGLAMVDAARAYAAYRRGGEAWMLGRFVVPAARLDELAAALREIAPNDVTAWPLSVLADARGDTAPAPPAGTYVAAIEAKARTTSELGDVRDFARRAGIAGEECYVEPTGDAAPEPLADAAASLGLALKLRTGGVTADAFPPTDVVLRFMRACVARGVPFKLTAGLHHPLRGEHPLTYEPGCPRGTMHGFLNVLAAAALLAAGNAAEDIAPLLEERDATSIEIGGDALRWRGLEARLTDLAPARRRLVSFGSCSFEEPVADLHALGILGEGLLSEI